MDSTYHHQDTPAKLVLIPCTQLCSHLEYMCRIIDPDVTELLQKVHIVRSLIIYRSLIRSLFGGDFNLAAW